MTDSPHPGEPVPETVQAAQPSGNAALSLARLAVAGVLLLAIGLVLLWQSPSNGPQMSRGQFDVMGAKLGEIDGLSAKVAALEGKQAPVTDLGPITSRLDALEKRPEAVATNLAPIESRLSALEGRPVGASPADVAGMASRLDGFAQRVDQLAAHEQTDMTTLSTKLDGATSQLGQKLDAATGPLAGKLDAASAEIAALSAKLDATSTATGATVGDLGKRVDALEQRLSKLETSSAQITALAGKTQLLARLQAAQASLDSGQPVGEVPGAPPALAKFAHDAPPTLASLRLSFPAAAASVQQASLPVTNKDNALVDRMWARMQQTVTVRQGDDLLVGNPVGGVLARARSALDAGDVAGAVKALDALTGPPADAMKPWRAQAQSLLDAQSALATLEGQA